MSTPILIQIYEVQTPSDAEKLIALGVDHIGSVVVSGESWKIPEIRDTVNRIHDADGRSSLIPLFRDLDAVCLMLDYYRPDVVHFCELLSWQKEDGETRDELVLLQKNVKKRFPEIEIMRSIPIHQPGMADDFATLDLARMFEPVSDYFLTDTLIAKGSGSLSDHQPVKGFVGITGKICDWDVAAELVRQCRIPVILAGGITPDNVFDGIVHVQPAGVDSCTGTNAVDAQGRSIRFKKDFAKIKRLIDAVHRAEKFLGPGLHK
jgi:phosphoribosylanthranilate isomerase